MRKIFKFAMCAVALLMATDVVLAQTADKNILTNVFRREKDGGMGDLPEAFLKCRVETLKEAGTVEYEIFRSCLDPQAYVFYEVWRNDAGHQAHSATDHLKTLISEMGAASDPEYKGFVHRAYIGGEPTGERLWMNIIRKVKPEHISTLRDSFLKSREATLKEEGCEAFEIYQSVLDPTIFLIYELWTTDEAHTIHSTLPHSKVHSEECQGINEPSFKTKVHKIFIK
ncbi:MAG: antibiotic biosynthesis monooxygenase [Rikenellaceae bacterium]|nr:antibiotic biosynthesis monooxygenase [Rikenellaceae bacterium]